MAAPGRVKQKRALLALLLVELKQLGPTWATGYKQNAVAHKCALSVLQEVTGELSKRSSGKPWRGNPDCTDSLRKSRAPDV